MLLLAACATPDLDTTPTRPPVDAAVLERTLGLAARAIAESRFDDANQILERVLVADPEHPEALLLTAEMRLAAGDPTAAVQAFQVAVALEPVRSRAQQGKGISLILIGDEETGLRSLREAVAADPALWRAWNALGAYHDGRQEWAAAATAYVNGIAAKPDSALLYNNRGYSFLLQRRTADAIADFSRALELSPGFEAAELNLRIALAWSGEYNASVAGVPEAELPEALNNAGYVALLRGDYASAESLLLRSIESDYGFNRRARENLNYLDGLQSQSDVESIEVE